MTYPAGSFYVSLAQPKMGLIRYLLGETHYPDNEHTRRQDGTPIRPYDMGQDVLAEYMGIRADPLERGREGRLREGHRADRARRARSPPRRRSATSSTGG